MSKEPSDVMGIGWKEAAKHYKKFLLSLGISMNNEHMEDTPERVAKSRFNELFRGMRQDPRKHLETSFSEIGQYDGDAGWVVVDKIQVKSICAHHMLPFTGQAHVGYIPQEEAVGLSKIPRLVDGYARRPQIQERLTNQIANAMHEVLNPLAVIVVIEAKHDCMCLRGIEEPNAMNRTSALRGKAREEKHLKDEFFQIVGNRK